MTLGAERPLSKNGYVIMPSTYESKVQGSFIISVKSSQAFELVPFKWEIQTNDDTKWIYFKIVNKNKSAIRLLKIIGIMNQQFHLFFSIKFYWIINKLYF